MRTKRLAAWVGLVFGLVVSQGTAAQRPRATHDSMAPGFPPLADQQVDASEDDAEAREAAARAAEAREAEKEAREAEVAAERARERAEDAQRDAEEAAERATR